MKKLFLLFNLLQFSEGYCQFETLIGTLVVVTPSKKGLVIAADRRFTLTSSKTTFYDGTKTTRLNDYYGFVVAGLREERDSPIDLKYFNVVDEIKGFFAARQEIKIDNNTLNELGESLKKAYQEKKAFLNFFDDNLDRKLICEIIIFGYDKEIQEYKMGYVVLNYSFRETTARYILFPKSHFLRSNFIAIGVTAYVNNLKINDEDPYKTLRQEKAIIKLIKNGNSLSSLKDVVKFSKFLIMETSNRYQTVGNIVDFTLVSPKGYKFVKRE